MTASLPLAGRVALVTGVSRRIGIGAAIAQRLLADGASVFATGWDAHDAEMPWGADAGERSRWLDPGDAARGRFEYDQVDLEHAAACRDLVDAVVERFGRIDILVANHARSSHMSFEQVTAEELDRCWAANGRASVLLAQRLGQRLDTSRATGRIVLFCSAQHIGPMDGEIAYAVSKGAVHQMTASLANALADTGTTVNCINPGPVDTGYARGNDHARIARLFPSGHWGQPADVARLVAWLVGDEAAWITGQVINSEGGFRRYGRRLPVGDERYADD